MTINCTYDAITGILNCDVPYIVAVDAGNGQTAYVSTLWTGGEMLISLFLFILVLFFIGREIFFFFFPRVIRIKRKND